MQTLLYAVHCDAHVGGMINVDVVSNKSFTGSSMESNRASRDVHFIKIKKIRGTKVFKLWGRPVKVLWLGTRHSGQAASYPFTIATAFRLIRRVCNRYFVSRNFVDTCNVEVPPGWCAASSQEVSLLLFTIYFPCSVARRIPRMLRREETHASYFPICFQALDVRA